MTLTHRIRLYMRTWGTRTIGQVVAAMSKHVTAPQAMREAETILRYQKTKHKFVRDIPKKDPVQQGKRVVITKMLRIMFVRGELARIAPGTYRIKKR